jgi:hypothetical protein
LEGRVALAAYTWGGGAGDGYWMTVGNWLANGQAATAVPGPQDDVTLGNAAVKFNAGSDQTIKSLTLNTGGNLYLGNQANGTWNTGKKLIITGSISFNSGSITALAYNNNNQTVLRSSDLEIQGGGT